MTEPKPPAEDGLAPLSLVIGRGCRAPRLLLGAIGASDAASGAFASAASLTARWCRGFFASIVHFAYHRAPGAARPDREPGM